MQLHKQKETTYFDNTFITSQFSYCSFVWMSHSRTKNNRINKIHEKALRNFYKDEKISLLMIYWKKDKSVSINQTNLYILATEIRWKVSNNLRPEIVKGIFHFVQKSYNLKNDWTLQTQSSRTVYFGTESISCLAPKIWELVPGSKIKNAKLLDFLFFFF